MKFLILCVCIYNDSIIKIENFNTNEKDSLIKINKSIKLKVFANRRVLMDLKKRYTYLVKGLIGVVVVIGCVMLGVVLGTNSNGSLGLIGIDGKLIY